jgi:hypothetical protein
MFATFISGPCGNHSHAIDDSNDIPQTLPPVCGPRRREDDATGYYGRVGSAHEHVNVGSSAATDVIFYKWVAEEGKVQTENREQAGFAQCSIESSFGAAAAGTEALTRG